MNQARHLAARINDLRLRRNIQMTLDLPDGDESRDVPPGPRMDAMMPRCQRAGVAIRCAGLLFFIAGCDHIDHSLGVSERFYCAPSPLAEHELERRLSEMQVLPSPKVLILDALALRTRIADGLNIRCLLDGLDEHPMNASVMSSRDRGGWIEQRIVLRDVAVDDVQALLLLPKGMPQPRPAVIGLHGHGHSAEIFARRFMGADLAGRGFVVLLPEFRFTDEHEVSLSLMRKGSTLMGRRVYETLLMIKYLRSLPAVDRHHIGMISHSGGSSAANLIVRLTDWVTAQVSDFEHDYLRGTHGTSGVHCETIPALYPLSATINNKLSLKIPRLNVEYGFELPSTRWKISEFLARPSTCSKQQPSTASSCVDRAQWALDISDARSSLMYMDLALRTKPGKSDLGRIAKLCKKLDVLSLSLSVATLMDVCPSLGRGFLLARADMAMRLEDRAAAMESLARVEESTAEPDDLRRSVWIYLKLGELSLASNALDALVRKSPDDAGLRLDLAEAATRLGDKAAALKSLPKFEESTAEPDVLRRYVWIYLKLGELSLASNALDALVRKSPDDAGLRLDLAEAATRLGDKAAALASFRQANVAVHTDEDRRRVALGYKELREYPRAIAILRQLARRNPLNPSFFNDLGICEYLAGFPSDAIMHLEQAISRDPSWPPAYHTLGTIYISQGRSKDALKLYDAALHILAGSSSEETLNLIRLNRDAILTRIRSAP